MESGQFYIPHPEPGEDARQFDTLAGAMDRMGQILHGAGVPIPSEGDQP